MYLIPLVFALVAAISPKNMVKYIGLAGAVATLIATVVKAMAFQTGSTVLVYDPELVTSFGLTFKMGYDGMGLFMVSTSANTKKYFNHKLIVAVGKRRMQQRFRRPFSVA